MRRRRKELDLTQSELADLAEVSERLVRDLEGGRLTIGTDKFLAILDALGLQNTIVRSQSNQGQSHE